jgi:hypothetical protein
MGPTTRLIEAKNPDEATRQTIASEIEAAFAAEAAAGRSGCPRRSFWSPLDARVEGTRVRGAAL